MTKKELQQIIKQARNNKYKKIEISNFGVLHYDFTYNNYAIEFYNGTYKIYKRQQDILKELNNGTN